MEINRRQFSLLLAGSLIAPSILTRPVLADTMVDAQIYTAAAKVGDDQYALLVVNSQGEMLVNHPLPGRAHHVELHPNKPIVAVVARRPGTFIDVVDYQQNTLLKRINVQDGQRFYGHAIYTPDGRYLLSTENDIANQTGLIVVRDSLRDYQVVDQYSSGGIGPHELKLMQDGTTLVVANGGIITHPDKGREKLNLDTMQPTLAYINIENGWLLEQVLMPANVHQLSIRHFDINAQGRVAIGLQYEGDKVDDVPLVAFHSRGEALKLSRAPTAVNYAMNHYCGSSRFDKSGQVAAISSPRGDLITFWRANGEFMTSLRARDGCGVSATSVDHEFMITTGRGRTFLYNVSTGKKSLMKRADIASLSWDNHLTRIS